MTPLHLAASTVLAEEAPKPLIPEWPEIILVVCVFGALWYLMQKFVAPRFEKTYAERRDAIEGGIARAEQAQAEAQAALKQYQQQLADARGEAAQIRENARAEAQQIVEEMRTQAQEESARIVARGEEQLAGQRASVVRELRGEIGGLAVELSERIVGQQLSDDARVQQTVDAFLAELQQRDTAAGANQSGGSN